MKKGWWYHASTEERLAQIDGAIELGMTAQQCAMNCGCNYESRAEGSQGVLVDRFANRHGRRFPFKSTAKRRANGGYTYIEGKVTSRIDARIDAAKQAYLSGEPVDIWSVK